MRAPKATRGIRLSIGDVDGDGIQEVAGLWAEEVRDSYEGLDSRLHGWVLQTDRQAATPVTDDIWAYVRILGTSVDVQERGQHSLYEGEVERIAPWNRDGPPNIRPVSWGGKPLFQLTRLDRHVGLTWTDGQRLELVLSLCFGRLSRTITPAGGRRPLSAAIVDLAR